MVLPFILVFVTIALLAVSLRLWEHRVRQTRENHIRTFAFPKGLFAKVIAKYPHLTQKDMELVSHGLRQFFLAYLKSGKLYVSMPSQVADELWHEFILNTRNYEQFTRQAFGGFLHHTPAVALTHKGQSNVGLRRCWRHACHEEHINPRKPTRLPLLFALDAKLGIADGFHYVPDCHGVKRQGSNDGSGGAVHCGGDFADGSIDGSTDGLTDGHGHGDGSDGSDGGCGGGCGGD